MREENHKNEKYVIGLYWLKITIRVKIDLNSWVLKLRKMYVLVGFHV